MGGSYETSPDAPGEYLRTLKVAALMDGLLQAAEELVADLPKWELTNIDREAGVLTCRRAGGFLQGTSTITVTLEAPEEGIPATTVNLKSVTEGGLLARDKANVTEFLKLYSRRTSASR